MSRPNPLESVFKYTSFVGKTVNIKTKKKTFENVVFLFTSDKYIIIDSKEFENEVSEVLIPWTSIEYIEL